MPRQARKKAESGIYHIMLRGIDRQQIFEDDEDYCHFLNIVQECHEMLLFDLFAYCLMGNHVHMLLKERDESLETIFKKIGSKYVYYYNVKYQRVGHLFQDRFRSEPVEDDEYFLMVLRYIHQNPVKAKLCRDVGEYTYSSYTEYFRDSTIVDTQYALSMLAKDQFIEFNSQRNEDQCLEMTEPTRRAVTDGQAKTIIEKISHCCTITEFQQLDNKAKERFIPKIYKKGVSIRQLSRLTGISKGMVEKYLKS